MSIKDLFNKKKHSQISKAVPLASASLEAEGSTMLEAKRKEFERFVPPIDFSTASNYAKFGSSELYFENSFKRIYNEYPYDGTLAEKVEFENSSSYLDRYVFDNLYPRTNGYAVFSVQGTAANAINSTGSTTAGWSRPVVKEYIYVRGGPHTASNGMINKTFHDTFDNSMLYSTTSGSKKGSSFETNMVSGSTIEFWMKKSTFLTSSRKQAIFDLWNGVNHTVNDGDYGRMTLYLSRSTNSGDQPFALTLRSGSTGFNNLALGSSQASSSIMDGAWHHYAVTIQSASGDSLKAELFIDGDLDYATVSAGNYIPEIPIKASGLNACLGSLITASLDHLNTRVGDGKLSASMDDFRFWKVARTPEQISQTWNIPIGGGTNKHDSNKDLGLYFKFNEGVTGVSATDAKVLDYSGRIANGEWTGYASGSRKTTSAFVESGKVEREFRDPIVYSTHPDVSASITQYKASGSLADRSSTSMFYNLFPAWMQESDTEHGKQLKYLSQIISSYFDTLWYQINYLDKIHDKQYITGSSKAFPFAKKLLESKGFMMPDLFVDASISEIFMKKNESHVFEKDITEVKNLIYHNIYNNLEEIYKTKGTEKSFRNFFRAVGINSDLVKLKMYADDSTYVLRDNFQNRTYEKNYINFNTEFNTDATIYQTSSSAGKANSFIHTGSAEFNKALTLEAEIVLPEKRNLSQTGYFNTNFLTSSVAGFWTANTNPDNFAQISGSHDLHIVIARDKYDHQLQPGEFPTIRFGISSSHNSIPNVIYGPRIYNQYKDNKWNISLTFKDTNYPYSSFVSGAARLPVLYDVGLYGIETDGVIKRNEFSSSTTANRYQFVNQHKRIYAGANRTAWTGSVLIYTDIKLGSLRYWKSYVPPAAIEQNAFDPSAHGISQPHFPDVIMISSASIPRAETLVLHWGFNTVTGSGTEGKIRVPDLSSGSYTDNILGATFGQAETRALKSMHIGKGYGFLANATSSISKEYLSTAQKSEPDNLYSSDLVTIQDESTENFFSDSDVSDNFYSFEKSMYGVISEEMLKMFSTVKDFSNLIGQPNQRYHSEYHKLNYLKNIFFNDVENEPDIEKFTRFYKWIDDSISAAISQLIPASARFSPTINNMVESHVLERNKYTHKVGLLTRRESTEGSIKGINELTYNWKEGHAPIMVSVSGDQRKNCLWWSDRERISKSGETAATATWTFTDKGNEETTVTIIDGNGLSKTFEVDNDRDGASVAGAIAMDPPTNNAAGMAAILISSVNSSGLAITATAGSGDAGEVLLTQDVVGTVGHTTITFSNYSNWNANTSGTLPVIFTGAYGVARISGSINTVRDVINNHSLQSSGLIRRKTDGTAYYGSTYAIRKLAKPYIFDAVQKKSIHAGVNFSRPKNYFLFSEATAPFGTAASSPNNIITVGLGDGNTGIVEKQVCKENLKPGEKSRFSFKAKLGFSDDTYAHSLNGDLVSPFNFMSGTVHTGYNAETKRSFRSDVIITNLHSDITDFTNEIPMQGPFTETHVGGHQRRHIAVNRYNETKTATYSRETGGAYSAAIIRFTSSNDSLTYGDSVRVQDFDESEVTAQHDSYYDLYNNKWSTAAELKLILEDKLDVTVSYVQSAGASSHLVETLSVTLDEKGAGTSRVISASCDTAGVIFTGTITEGAAATYAGGGNPTNISIDRDLDDSSNRPEAFGIVMKEHPVLNDNDGAFGIVPADYGNTSHAAGNLPWNVDKPRATRFRDEHAKRPVNIRNILYGTGSTSVGNYRKGHEIVMLQNESHRSWLRDNIDGGLVLPSTINSALPSTTNYLTLMSQAPWINGNYFGSGSNRHPDKTSEIILMENIGASFNCALNITGNANPVTYTVGVLRVDRQLTDPYDIYSFRFALGVTNATTSVLSSGPGIGSQLQVNVLVVAENWPATQTNFISAVNDFPGSIFTAEFLYPGEDSTGATIKISESPSLVATANGGGITTTSAMLAAYSRVFAGGAENVTKLSADDVVIEIPRTDKSGSSTFQITNRFSAPGGPEIQSMGYLDAQSHAYSVHNAMPFRNLSVLNDSGEPNKIRVVDHLNKRRGLRSLLQVHQGKGGLDSEYLTVLSASNYGLSGSYVKQHRNNHRRMQFSGETIITGSGYDNGYVSSTIPRSDFQYGWINAAITGSNFRDKQRILGHAPPSGRVTSSLGWVEAIVFPTSSHVQSN